MHKFKMKVEKCDNRVINKDYNTDFLYLLPVGGINLS